MIRIKNFVGVCLNLISNSIDESSYSPGLLRPSLTNTSSLIDLVHNLHMNNLSVIIDLNWESFKKSTLFGSYHSYYTKCNYHKINIIK